MADANSQEICSVENEFELADLNASLNTYRILTTFGFIAHKKIQAFDLCARLEIE